jgi:hypothetical protein
MIDPKEVERLRSTRCDPASSVVLVPPRHRRAAFARFGIREALKIGRASVYRALEG